MLKMEQKGQWPQTWIIWQNSHKTRIIIHTNIQTKILAMLTFSKFWCLIHTPYIDMRFCHVVSLTIFTWLHYQFIKIYWKILMKNNFNYLSNKILMYNSLSQIQLLPHLFTVSCFRTRQCFSSQICT